MKLIAFSDLHHYAGDRESAIFNKAGKLTQYAMPMLTELVERVNGEYRPDAVVNLGDSIQDANEKAPDIISLRDVANKIAELECPCYTVMGNHDLKMFDTLDEAKEIFGYDSFNYSVDIDGYHLVFTTNGIVPERGTGGGGVEKTHYAVKETVDFLRADLEKNEKPCIIFNHYPFIAYDGMADRMLIQNVSELFEIIDKHKNVIAVISGHTHIPYTRVRKGVDYIVLGSPIASPQHNDIPDGFYYEIDVENNKVTVKEHIFKKELK